MARLLSAVTARSNLAVLRKANTLFNAIASPPGKGIFLTNAIMTDREWQSIIRYDYKERLLGYHPSTITEEFYQRCDSEEHLQKVLYTDIKTYLVGDILVKVDRMSMANSLEVRAPLLDYKVVEYAAKMPPEMKLRGNEKKYALKKVFSRLLPSSILYRKKMGFSVPLAQWLREEVKPLCEQYVLKPDAGIYRYFNKSSVFDLWNEHQSGKYDHAKILWSLLMFELWWQEYMESADG
jgi:asparagine synthase (glutamine-hydrolysing)